MEEKLKNRFTPIAVVGVSAIFPGAVNVTGYWKNIMEGVDLIEEIPPDYWFIEDYYDPNPFAPDKTYCKRGAFIPEIDFDPIEFGIPPANLPHTDTSQLLGLVVAKKVLEDASNGQFKNIPKDKISVILGVGSGLELLGEMTATLQRPVIERVLREEGFAAEEVEKFVSKINKYSKEWRESTFPGLLTNVVAGRIANRFDLKGTNCTADAACASSFASLHLAVDELIVGQSDLVITGGVDTCNNPFMFVCFSKTPALSISNDCRPFSDKADGMILGEGLGFVALKRLEDAERDGDKIYAVIRGVGSSSDGRAKSIYAPLPEGQALALRRAYESAGYSPATIDLVEAHGTGTRAGDISEFTSLTMVFDEAGRKQRQWCALGSVKSQIGHTKSAAAVAGLIKAIMALNHRVLPPTIKIDMPDPKMDFESSPFYLNTTTRPWIKDPNYPRRAAVSSFGFGGTNYHVTLEEYSDKNRKSKRLRTLPFELFLFSSDSVDDLFNKCNEIKNVETEKNDEMFRFFSRDTQLSYNVNKKYKLAIIAKDYNKLLEHIDFVCNKIKDNPNNSFSLNKKAHYSCEVIEGKTAFLFPGQGSQYINMTGELAMFFDNVIAVWDEAAKYKMEGLSLNNVVFPIPVFSEKERKELDNRLTKTEWAQPAITVASLSVLYLLEQIGLKADCVGGHSLGEITALYKAGIVDFESVIEMARKRGELMAQSSDVPATMIAVKCSYNEILDKLREWGSDVVVANYNAPDQIVLSGSLDAIEEVEVKLKELGNVVFRRLNVSTAFHSPLMEKAREPFLQFLQDIEFKKPSVNIYSNVGADVYPDSIESIKNLLGNQIISSVMFAEEVKKMYSDGVRCFVEVGPHSVLSSLVKQCLADKDDYVAVSTLKKGENEIEHLWNALGLLAVKGVHLEFSKLWDEYVQTDDPREREKHKMLVKLRGYNYGRKYPPLEEIERRKKLGTNYIKKDVAIIDKIARNKKSEKNVEDVRSELAMSEKKLNKMEDEKINSEKQREMLRPKQVNKMNPSIIQSFVEMQRQATVAYTTFQKTMVESHLAFMKSAESAARVMGQLMGAGDIGASIEMPKFAIPEDVDESMQAPAYIDVGGYEEATTPARSEVEEELYDQPQVKRVYREEEQAKQAKSEEDTKMAEPVVDDKSLKGEVVEKIKEAGEADLEKIKSMSDEELNDLVFRIIVDKTGYPREILDLDMDLESDLGIDSIKRVEILSALKDEFPGLPDVDMEEVASIKKLREVVTYMRKLSSGEADTSVSTSEESDVVEKKKLDVTSSQV
jgi:polyketide-type polyunsaturated fatty acid synthase PfaA